MNNPIIDEIRKARAALAEEHGFDLKRINDWARKQTEARAQLSIEKPAKKSRRKSTVAIVAPKS